MKSPIPKERLRVSNWIVRELYTYAVKVFAGLSVCTKYPSSS